MMDQLSRMETKLDSLYKAVSLLSEEQQREISILNEQGWTQPEIIKAVGADRKAIVEHLASLPRGLKPWKDGLVPWKATYEHPTWMDRKDLLND